MTTKADLKVDSYPTSNPSDQRPAWAYIDGRVVPYGEVSFGLLTHALNYGTGVFAGLRAYWNESEGELFVFRPEDHFRRFRDSARLLRMEIEATPEDLTGGVIELLRAEGFSEDCYIRPLAFYGDERIGLRLHGLTPRIGIAAVPLGPLLAGERGVHATFSSWTRVSDNVIPPRGKIAGSYVNSALARTDAMLAGFDEALMLNTNGHLCEGSVENVFIARAGVVATPPATDDILEGITRATVIHLLRQELGRTVVERPIDRTEVYLADEVFFCGTGAQIAAVTRVDHRTIGEGTIGPLCATLLGLHADVVRGRNPRYRSWCRPVHGDGAAQRLAPIAGRSNAG